MKKCKTVRFHEVGSADVLKLETIELTPPLRDEIQIKHKAIGINYIDTYYRSGLYQTPLPSGLGFEASGVVEAVGADVKYFKVGDRVTYPQSKIGSYSEYHNVQEKNVVKLPEGISFEEGAAMMLKGLTVQYLLRQIHPLKSGDTILFHAAAGGVGLIACQWARHLGLKLIGTASSPEKMALARENGAYEMIDYTKEDVVQKVKEITKGEKVSVVFDSVGKSTWESSLDCLSPRGLMVSFGNASGPVTGVNLSQLAQKGSLYVTRPVLGAFIDTHEKLVQASEELFSLVLDKKIKISISHQYPLDKVREAHQFLESRKNSGSLILIP